MKRKIYDNRVKVSVTLSFLLFIGLLEFFGGSSCASGWVSSSIGKRGACSSHGGVVNYTSYLIVASVIFGILLFNYLENKYVKRRGYLVRSNLKPHPLELLEGSLPPSLKSKSRKVYGCVSCYKKINVGDTYYYHTTRHKKYCESCKNNLQVKYAEIELQTKEWISRTESCKDIIDKYYKENSI
ncbi:hypothetical protein HHE92_03095 [Pseudoalteromonas arctica]|uniref:hypothetical protein n=1 Tax=Pseudoalteromonas arctica TaxID=394751 RepID=UPI00145C1E6E|nr:hypothetical protein [Pseudoalteromonas arctica]NMP78785.1 hypothetical protein [Pseudoalteromonas arctica]